MEHIATYDILLKKMFTPSLDLHIYTYFNNIACCFFYRKLKKDSLKFEYSMGVSPFDSFETFSPHNFTRSSIWEEMKIHSKLTFIRLEWFPKKSMAIWVFP